MPRKIAVAARGSAADGPKGNAVIVLIMCAAVGLIIANMVIPTIAIPEIGRSLRASQSQVQWIGDVYPLVLAGLLLPAGALADRFGRKRGLICGLAILAVSLAWSAYTPSADQLILSRTFAGVGAALAFPATLATITSTFDASKRGGAVGLWALSTIVGGFVGFLMGGALTQYFWWGASFVACAVLVLACLIVTVLIVPETRDPAHANFDPVGATLSCAGIGAFVLAVTEEPLRGWSDDLTVGGLVVGTIGLVAFIGWELRAPRPLLDLRHFRDRSFGIASLTIFVMFMCDLGVFFLYFQYDADVLGYGPLKSAIRFIPACAALLPIAPLGPVAARRFGRRLVLSTAMTICAVGYFLTAVVGDDGSYWAFTVCLGVFWAGVALAMGPATEAIIEALPPAEQGVASAVNDLARELGAAVGIAVIGSAFNAGYRSRVSHLLGPRSGSIGAAIKNSPTTGLQAVARLGAGSQPRIAVIHEGFFAGFRAAMLTGTVALVAVAICVALRYPSSRRVPALSPVENHAGPGGGTEECLSVPHVPDLHV
jgi:EmrB/QacA subfamily drug resistance transporter